MTHPPQNSIQTHLASQAKLYEKFKKKCIEQNISLKTGIREAILLWFRNDMGDKEFTRYLAQEEIRKEIVGLVRSALRAKTIAEAGALLRQIPQDY